MRVVILMSIRVDFGQGKLWFWSFLVVFGVRACKIPLAFARGFVQSRGAQSFEVQFTSRGSAWKLMRLSIDLYAWAWKVTSPDIGRHQVPRASKQEACKGAYSLADSHPNLGLTAGESLAQPQHPKSAP